MSILILVKFIHDYPDFVHRVNIIGLGHKKERLYVKCIRVSQACTYTNCHVKNHNFMAVSELSYSQTKLEFGSVGGLGSVCLLTETKLVLCK